MLFQVLNSMNTIYGGQIEKTELESQIGLNTCYLFFFSYEVKKKIMQINVSRHANVYMRLIYPALFNKF